MSASPMGVPGWPLSAFSTASIDRVLIVLTASSMVLGSYSRAMNMLLVAQLSRVSTPAGSGFEQAAHTRARTRLERDSAHTGSVVHRARKANLRVEHDRDGNLLEQRPHPPLGCERLEERPPCEVRGERCRDPSGNE